jgi:hypothetical protein
MGTYSVGKKNQYNKLYKGIKFLFLHITENKLIEVENYYGNCMNNLQTTNRPQGLGICS